MGDVTNASGNMGSYKIYRYQTLCHENASKHREKGVFGTNSGTSKWEDISACNVPPNATTMRMEDSASFAMSPAFAYASCASFVDFPRKICG